MLYRCGHRGCDVCGARECDGNILRKVKDYVVCDSCMFKAVRLAADVAATFSTYVDPSRSCKDETGANNG